MSINEEEDIITNPDEFEEGTDYLIEIGNNDSYSGISGIYNYTGISYKGYWFINLTYKLEILKYKNRYIVVSFRNLNDNKFNIINAFMKEGDCNIFKIETNEYVLK
jgi:hypothetical protein